MCVPLLPDSSVLCLVSFPFHKWPQVKYLSQHVTRCLRAPGVKVCAGLSAWARVHMYVAIYVLQRHMHACVSLYTLHINLCICCKKHGNSLDNTDVPNDKERSSESEANYMLLWKLCDIPSLSVCLSHTRLQALHSIICIIKVLFS